MNNEQRLVRQIERLVTNLYQRRKKNGVMLPRKVTVGWPVFDEKETIAVIRTLISGQLSLGPKVHEFEAMVARYVGKKYAVAVNSGSSANLLALTALIQSGRVSKGSEVIVPAATFPTVVSPIIQSDLIPVYVDVDPVSWNIDPQEIKKAITKKTRVVMPVHSFGNPANMGAIMKIAKAHGLIVLEDCCEAHGARIGLKKVGSFGVLSTWSFFVAHNITTGEGGMIFTDDKKLRDIMVSVREFGRVTDERAQKSRVFHDQVLGDYDTRYVFNRLGYNMRVTEIMAAIGVEQFKKLNALNRERQRNAHRLDIGLAPFQKYLRLPKVAKGTEHSYYAYPMIIESNAPFNRTMLTNFLEERGIETRGFMGGCLPDQPGFRNEVGRVIGRLPVSRLIRDRAFFVGCHPALSATHLKRIAEAFAEFFRTL